MRIAIDPGTASLRVAVRNRGVVLQEPSLLILDRTARRVLAVGNEAQAMHGRTPAGYLSLHPIRDGRVEDPDAGRELLTRMLDRALGWRWRTRPSVAVSVPSHTTDFDKQTLAESFVRAGARQAHLVERPLAAAQGAGIDIDQAEGTMVVDVGHGTTEVGIVSLGALAVSRTLPMGGRHLDDAVARHLRMEHGLDVGPSQAEALKIHLGSAVPLEPERTLEVHGRDLRSGRPRSLTLSSSDLRPALLAPLQELADVVRQSALEAPPVLAEDLIANGIVLTGASARLPGLARFLEERLGLPVRVADQPDHCVVLGALGTPGER